MDDVNSVLQRAADAVSELPQHLQPAAFQEVIRFILGGPRTMESAARSGRATSSRRARSTGVRRPARPRSAAKTADDLAPSIELKVADLERLRGFMQPLTLKGEEQTAFAIAMFLHESLGVDEFNATDLELCYRRLLSMKVRLPAVKNFKRACGWLAAPSRRKEWLERRNKGYGVSNAGLLAFQEFGRKNQDE